MTYIIVLYIYTAIILALGMASKRFIANRCYKVSCFLFVVAFIIYVGLRPGFFRDTEFYIERYLDVDWSYLTGFNLLAKESRLRVEYGYIVLMNIFKSVGIPYQIFFMLISLFFILVSARWIKEFGLYISLKDIKDGSFFSIYTIILFHFGIFYSLVAVRGCISLAFIMLSSIKIKNKEYLRAISYFLLAFSMQRMSALGLIPVAVILFSNIVIKKNIFLYLWVAFGVLLLVQYRTNYLMNTLGVQMQNLYNSVMDTQITLGFDKISNRSITKAIMYLGYWLNGFLYFIQYDENKNYSKFVIIYLGCLLLGAIVCGYPPSYRIVDYFYLYSLPVNYAALSSISKIRWKSSICTLTMMGTFYLVWLKSFIEWYRLG